MEQRRFKDIVAFKWNGKAPLAFHARNIEVAEISEQTWNEMLASNLHETNEARLALESWNSEFIETTQDSKSKYGIRSLTINVTQICNLKCTYCAAGGDGTYGAPQTRINVEKTLPQLKYFLEKVPDGENFKINFLGGEPLLYPDGIQEIANYVRLVTAGRKVQASFRVVTNGTLINDKTLAVLTNIRAHIGVSLDGPVEFNDYSRPSRDGSSSTQKTVEGLQKISQFRDSLGGLSIHGVFDKNNLEVFKAYEFYQQFSADSYEFTYSVIQNDDVSNRKFVDQMNLVAAHAFEKGGEVELRKISVFNNYFSVLDSQRRTENFCGAGKSILSLDASNNIFTCPWDVGDKDEQVGKGIDLDIARLSKYQDPLVEKNNCSDCWARFVCGGGCMFVHKQSTGSKHLKDGQFCFRTRSLISTALLYYKLSRMAC